MSNGVIDLPVNIPWKQIAVSPDMMDKRFCNLYFPYAWRSSLAISVHEPSLDELPEELCDNAITYLKITSTITGYQPSEGETSDANDLPDVLDLFPEDPTEDVRNTLERITDEYFACYGALLNIAVYPAIIEEEVVPIIIDFGELDGQPGMLLPNPFEHNGVKFEAEDQPNNRMADIYVEGGDGITELDLFSKINVKLPVDKKIIKVTAVVVHYSPVGVTMLAFDGNEAVDSADAGLETGEPHELTISSGDKQIDNVTIKAPENSASLLRFTYYVVEETTTPTEQIDLKEYPHIIDFEPKTRDLIQAATETGEILTGSKSGIKTDRSFINTNSSEDGFTLSPKIGKKDESGIGATLSHKNTETDQETWKVTADASRERRETNATVAQISQMYNLLSGYHAGTNRIVLLMLARPHTLQPTDHRTFVQGLRRIEGIQEYFLIVARPEHIDGLCVEAFVETGHYPEATTIIPPVEQYEESFEEFSAKAFADNGWFSGDCTDIESDETSTYTIASGWIIDRRESRMRQPAEPVGSGWDPVHPGIAEIENNSNSQADKSLERYDYRPTSDVSAGVFGTICGQSLQRDKARFNRKYRVFTRKEQPISVDDESQADIDNLLITRRELCVCFRSGDCPQVVQPPEKPIVLHPDFSIVEEPIIRMKPSLLTRKTLEQSREPATKEFIAQVENSLLKGWRSTRRYPLGQVGYLESDYFKNRIIKALSKSYLGTLLTNISDLPVEVIKAFGVRGTVMDALKLDLPRLAKKVGITMEESGNVRRILLGLPKKTD